MDKIHDIMAHDSEILSITYSTYRENSMCHNLHSNCFVIFPLVLPPLIGTMWLATGSRDRLIHVFDVTAGYSHTHTILDHSAAITSVKLIGKCESFHG